MAKLEQFSSRWGLLLATLGMAIGAGNIWRFPRLAGQYGGAFLIPWALFLVLWSIPLLMIELSLGKSTRKGPVGAFSEYLGKNYTWMGAFAVVCSMGIMFYYSVVTGWALKYFISATFGGLIGADHDVFWKSFTGSGYEPALYHLAVLAIASLIISRGVVAGIERANRWLLPSLLVLLLIGVGRSLTLPNASQGLNYLFGFHRESLANPRMWLEALSQSAWSTGAGWGLALTYGVYMREKEDVTLNAFITGFGNNSASLLAALAIIPAVFSLSGSTDEALAVLGSGNTGLSFIAIPQLFEQLPGAQILISLFFLALFFAALSSLIALLELATRFFMDFGLSRIKALIIVAFLTALLGLPSALSMGFFNNQDWVWGLGLIISGAFFAFAVIKRGVKRFRQTYLNVEFNDLQIGTWFDWVIKFVVPIEAIAILVFWSYQSVTTYDPEGWWHPFRSFSLGTCVVQWGLLILLLFSLNSRLHQMLGLRNP